MLSRLFLISTLLLVGITTVAIGAAIGKTIEVARAFKIPRMQSGNILNRRFISGVPGFPQCLNANFPLLESSSCVTAKTIRAACTSEDQPGRVDSDITCPDDTTCMDFVTIPNEEEKIDPFAVCIDDKFLRRFDSDHKSGVFYKTYVLNDVADAKATISINIYDINQKPAQITKVGITVGNQSGTRFNTHNYSRIIDYETDEKIVLCLQTGTKEELYGYFSFLDGTYIVTNF
ncbi:hypothetical protein Glove_198g4 [Diversispora epigaea]|uniref:Uncharacterized protein n=1 Tax=Diversispora epigaea TaxID=1348612 RepID=A0A397IND6_9GLOM|nr:hypothetical protein Glove_198g4 [Diversispora epigaea]